MMRTLFLAMASLFVLSDAIAQLQEGDTSKWQFNSSFAWRLNTGNVERLIVTPEANLSHVQAQKRWGFSARQRYTYGTFGPVKTENDWLSRNFVYLTPERTVYPYVMLWFQTHARQQLDFRYQAGVGFTVLPLKKGRQVIKVSLTATYEQNWYARPGLTAISDAGASAYSVVRATGRVFGSHTFPQNIVSVYYEFFFQQAVDNIDNWRIFTEGGISTVIARGFSMRTYVNYEHQSVHLAAVKPNDLILNVGLNYRVMK